MIRFLKFQEPAFSAQRPGAPHETIKAAKKAVATLQRLYATDKPTRKMLEANRGYLEEIDRGKCRYLVVHDKKGPSEILFAGYSYD